MQKLKAFQAGHACATPFMILVAFLVALGFVAFRCTVGVFLGFLFKRINNFKGTFNILFHLLSYVVHIFVVYAIKRRIEDN